MSAPVDPPPANRPLLHAAAWVVGIGALVAVAVPVVLGMLLMTALAMTGADW